MPTSPAPLPANEPGETPAAAPSHGAEPETGWPGLGAPPLAPPPNDKTSAPASAELGAIGPHIQIPAATPLSAPPAQALTNPALASLRAEIDGLDDAILDLLAQRFNVVAALRDSGLKAKGPAFRPGREASILRRLLARRTGHLPPAAVLRFWREIFAASTALQSPFAIALHAPTPEHAGLAREHFGIQSTMRVHPTPSRALAAVADGSAALAVLPLPQEGEAPEAAWWTYLDSPRLQIMARLPFLASNATEAGALVIGPGMPEPTGADRSLLRLELAEPRSRDALQQMLTSAALPPLALQMQRGPDRLRVLVETDGFCGADDPRLASLAMARPLPLGAYAIPATGE